MNSSALVKYWLSKENNLGSWVKPVLVKEQSVDPVTKHKNDPNRRSWGKKEESAPHSSQRGDAECAGDPCPQPEAIGLHTQRGSAIPEKEAGSREFVYLSFLTVFHLNCICILVTGLKIVFNMDATNPNAEQSLYCEYRLGVAGKKHQCVLQPSTILASNWGHSPGEFPATGGGRGFSGFISCKRTHCQ